MSKTKSWFKPISEEEMKQEKIAPENDLHAFKKPIEVARPTRKLSSLSQKNNQNWMKYFDPVTVDDLAVNKKKINELEEWLSQVSSSNCSEMLLVSGPVGCGKTATVHLLAKKYNFRISEWITPVDLEIPSDNGEYEYREKQSTQFQKFIINAANFTSLLDSSCSKKLVLIEDFPNTFLRTPSEFFHVLQQYKDRAKSPIIFICSESHIDSKNTPLSLFTTCTKDKFNIHHIVFNAVSQTGLKAALNRVSEIISKKFSSTYSKPTTDQIDCIANSSTGDVRSAVLNLHFACLKGTHINLETSFLKEKDKKVRATKRKKGTSSKFTSLGKDQTVSILHGVGRVLNPKVVTIDGKSRLTHQPEAVMEQFLSQPKSFVNFLAENYLPHFADIEQADRAACALSDADCLLAEWREKFCQEYGLYIAVAGLMVANKTPVSAWNPVRGPKYMNIQYPSISEIPLIEENNLYKGKILVTDYQTYCKVIAESTE